MTEYECYLGGFQNRKSAFDFVEDFVLSRLPLIHGRLSNVRVQALKNIYIIIVRL